MNFSVDYILNNLKPKRTPPVLQAHRELSVEAQDVPDVSTAGNPASLLDPRPLRIRQTQVKPDSYSSLYIILINVYHIDILEICCL